MPVPTWPSAGDFPQLPLNGQWQRQRQKNLLAFEPDVGPPLVRRRSTVSTLPATFTIQLTTTQAAALDEFHDIDCGEGSIPFTWDNPETGATETWAWVEPPAVSHVTGSIYRAQCSLRRDY